MEILDLQNETKYYLYKIIDKDNLIYIGKSTNIDNRMANHNILRFYFDYEEYFMCRGKSLSTPLIYIANVKNEYWLSIYETTLISKYKPIYNKTDVYDSNDFVHMDKLQWFPYITQENTNIIYTMKTGLKIEENKIDTPMKRWRILCGGFKC